MFSALLRPCSFNPLVIPTRGRKRRTIFLKKLELLKKLGLRYAKLRKAKPQVTYLEKLALKKAQTEGTCSEQWPAREPPIPLGDLRDLKFADNVYFSKYYKPRVFSLAEAIQMHKEMMGPTVFNYPDAELKLRLDINMFLEKESKHLDPVAKVLPIPHPFSVDTSRRICVFAKNEKAQQDATDAGAETVGGRPLVKKLLRGEVRPDFNYYLCNVDMVSEIPTLRGLLKHKFPTVKSGCIGTDMAVLVKHFMHGLEVSVDKDVKKPEYGVLVTNIGRIDMEVKEIEANLRAICTAVCALRPMTAKCGPTIHRAVLMCPPSDEYFHIPHEPYSPAFPEEELRKRAVLLEEKAKALLAAPGKKQKKKEAVMEGAPVWFHKRYEGLVE